MKVKIVKSLEPDTLRNGGSQSNSKPKMLQTAFAILFNFLVRTSTWSSVLTKNETIWCITLTFVRSYGVSTMVGTRSSVNQTLVKI